jgi:uncharacterized membrane protein YcaP (DUF421 family)
MDPIRVAARVLFAYAYLLLMVRISGKKMVGQGSTVEFVLAFAFADLTDDAMLGDVPLSQFVVASVTMFAMRLVLMNATVRTTVTKEG